MASRLTPEDARAAANTAVRALRNTWSMRPECKIALEHFTDSLFDAIDSQLRERDHWDVGGVEYGDRLMVLAALRTALAETAPKPRNEGRVISLCGVH
jgi:hypothetical protein